MKIYKSNAKSAFFYLQFKSQKLQSKESKSLRMSQDEINGMSVCYMSDTDGTVPGKLFSYFINKFIETSILQILLDILNVQINNSIQKTVNTLRGYLKIC